MANADQDVAARFRGQDPDTGAVLQYQYAAETFGRCTYTNQDATGPYRTDFGHGPVVGSAATYDQVSAHLRLHGSRHVDPLGNVPDPKKAWLVDWYWKLDGCPMPLTRERLALYIKLASELRPWPSNFAGAMPGEPTTDYTKVDPNTLLDDLT